MGTLTVSVTESLDITVGGVEHSFTTSDTTADLDIASVGGYFSQTLSIPTTGTMTQVLKFGSAASVGVIKASDFKYMRFHNAGSNPVTVQLSDATNDKQINYKLLAKETIYFTSLNFDCNSSTATASADVIQGTSNITSVGAAADEVRMMASTGASDVNIFVAYAV